MGGSIRQPPPACRGSCSTGFQPVCLSASHLFPWDVRCPESRPAVRPRASHAGRSIWWRFAPRLTALGLYGSCTSRPAVRPRAPARRTLCSSPPTVYGTPSPASATLRGGMRSAGDPPVGMHGIAPKCEPQQWVEATAAAAAADRGLPRVGFSPMRQANGPPFEKRVAQSSQTSGAMAERRGTGACGSRAQ